MTNRKQTVFYSWQSDLPNNVNRGFIAEALERASKALTGDDSIAVDLVVDRDTQDVPGSPDIAATIFKKIEEAAVFVADVSIVHRVAERCFPNPNVLVEVGYALKTLGEARVVLVMNSAFGGPELLPFDLRRKRVINYELKEGSDQKAVKRNELSRALERGMRQIFPHLEAASAEQRLREVALAVREGRSDQEAVVRAAMFDVTSKLDLLQPRPQQPGIFDEFLVEALPKTIPIVEDFARIVDVAARCDSAAAVAAVAEGLRPVLDGYFLPSRNGLNIVDVERGLSEFVGHEMLVVAVALLLRHHRWSRLKELLQMRHLVATISGRQHFGFAAFSASVDALKHRNRRLGLQRPFLHADLLKERHERGALAASVPLTEFIQADTFLFMAAELAPDTSPAESLFACSWVPWSFVLQRSFSYPRLIDELKSATVAERFCNAVGIPSVDTLRIRYTQRFVKALGALFPDAAHTMIRVLPEAQELGAAP